MTAAAAAPAWAPAPCLRWWEGRPLLVVLLLAIWPLVTPRLRGADEIEYFAYLRSAIFDRDLDFENEYRHFYEADPGGLAGFKATFLDRREPISGRHINFAPIGAAVLWSPFYVLAHAGVLVSRALGADVAADGLSRPYVAAVAYASALYGFLGLLLAQDALRRFGGFTEPDPSWSVAALWLGTPVVYYMTIAPGFSHAPSLFTVGLLLWLSLRLRDHGGAVAAWALVGAVAGLAALVREQDALFLVVPLGFALFALPRRGAAWAGARLFALAAAAVAVFAPQLLAYRATNGTFSPSPLVRRKMMYTSPHFLEVLFDPGHGLFPWTPLLFAATAGLVLLVWRRRDLTAGLLALALVLQVWINGSVESWTLAGAFGSRRFVSATPVLAWGLAALLASLRPRLGRAASAAVLAVFVWWNLSLIVQFGLRLMDRQRLEWPRVAVNQVTEVPPRLGRTAWLFLTDRERLVRETR